MYTILTSLKVWSVQNNIIIIICSENRYGEKKYIYYIYYITNFWIIWNVFRREFYFFFILLFTKEWKFYIIISNEAIDGNNDIVFFCKAAKFEINHRRTYHTFFFIITIFHQICDCIRLICKCIELSKVSNKSNFYSVHLLVFAHVYVPFKI